MFRIVPVGLLVYPGRPALAAPAFGALLSASRADRDLHGQHLPLITCPDCRQEVSDAAPACPRCGRPAAGSPAPAEKAEITEGQIAEFMAGQKAQTKAARLDTIAHVDKLGSGLIGLVAIGLLLYMVALFI